KLGEGGMGAVFLARDTRLGRRVAIKFLSSTDPELTKRFVIEARATARVEHENIVSIYEVGEWGGHPFMVLQFLQGQELTKVIPRGKQMPVPRVIEIMMPVLRALAYAHGEGIVHRDLKPDNIFLTDGGVVKVLDFGIAKVVQGDDKTSDGEAKLTREDLAALGQDKGMTRHGAVMGTMPFMSPEQWGNGVAIDHTSDIWAVGVMMFIMLSGRHPLYPLSGHELMVTAFLDEPMPSLKEKAPDVPKEVCEVVDKCLEKDKAKRWPDALALLRALEPLLSARTGVKLLSSEESPYAGLHAFQEEDAGRFFGRSREVAAMTQRLRERPLMGVIGPSGIGKSSFLRAGVVPALKNSGENWEIRVIRPGNEPLMAVAGLISSTSTATSQNIAEDIEAQRKMADRLRKEPGYLGTALRRMARREKKNLLLFIDQFEETYTLVHDQDERLAYTAAIAAAADDPASPLRVVLSMRSDFLDRCTEDLHFMNELSQGLFFLTPMTREGMREAMVLPAEMAGYKFEKDEMVNEMLDHLASTSGALPLLQFTADMLWGERDPTKKVLTEKSYRNLGGISGALATHAERVIEQVPPDQRNLVRALFLRLVTPERTRAIVSLSELKDQFGKQGDIGALIDQLVTARLLTTSSSGGGAATVEIVHESLIHGWPQLAKWLDEGQEDAAFLEQLRNASRQWQAKNKDTGLLWRGEMVEEAKRFVRRFRGNLPEVQQHFLKAVIDASNRAARIKKAILVAAGIVVMALLAAAAVALYVINESRSETQKQAIAAQESEKRATAAAVEAQEQKVEAEKAKEAAERALAEAKAAELQKEAAREAEQKALILANKSKEELALALVDAQNAEKKAVRAAAEATAQKAIAEQKAREANEAKAAAQKSADEATKERNRAKELQAKAEAQAKDALEKLNEVTRGGVIEVLR
ncbi:MAG TPA: protein kinase, partial [Myxococcota bacterium]|nr:protein kinase [Myxococcota bacterium]